MATASFFRARLFAAGRRRIGWNRRSLGAAGEDVPRPAPPAYAAGWLGDLFSRPGLIGGFAAGFLGAGVFGLLFGHGLVGELSGVPSILGLILQFPLLLALGRLIWAWWRVDRKAAVSQLSPRQLADAYERDRKERLLDIGTEASGKANRENCVADEAHLPLYRIRVPAVAPPRSPSTSARLPLSYGRDPIARAACIRARRPHRKGRICSWISTAAVRARRVVRRRRASPARSGRNRSSKRGRQRACAPVWCA